ncbi:MAG TPA: DUF3322 domain-containing protein [Ideonella sp.]|nr:DUF3322 domain-containing protein [Ideonella sp.]
MGWTTAAELRAQAQKLWDKGWLLAAMVAPEGRFPLRLAIKGPASADLSERFDEVRRWAREPQQGALDGAGYRLVLREVRHRVIGQNALPQEAWLDDLDDALKLVARQRDAMRFGEILACTRASHPGLLPWLQQAPLRALALAGEWPRLLSVVGWLQARPRPGIYLRQVDLPGIDSKFIEAHRAVLCELLDAVLPESAIERAASGSAQFAQRYGFRPKPLRVRLRGLDPGPAGLMGNSGDGSGGDGGDRDITITQESFNRLAPAAIRVLITENEINFLCLPPLAAGLAIFGAGYGFEGIAQAGWLRHKAIWYWGDIDTHGFAILDQLRGHFPQARSLLMDRATLLAHRAQWTREPQPTLRELGRLGADERALYDDLRWHRLGETAVRLEQERIAFHRLEQALAAIDARE